MKASGEEAFIGLGSNLGDREAAIESAFAEIAALPGTTLAGRSSLYESAPLAAGGGDYLNAVARVRTTLAPLELLRALQAIEARHGRLRPFANAPRTLDLDLLLYGEVSLATGELTLPHPRLGERAFVLLPLHEVAPELHLPGGARFDELLAGLGRQRVAKLVR
ncbi:MAG: 2-amino-4-hydroxy-6-hydroxymethyldihydropteridine diphosphokinase [Caldimonas sp.]